MSSQQPETLIAADVQILATPSEACVTLSNPQIALNVPSLASRSPSSYFAHRHEDPPKLMVLTKTLSRRVVVNFSVVNDDDPATPQRECGF